MKVVINRCFGGFSLSKQAVKRMAKLQGRECYFFTIDHKDFDRYIPDSLESAAGLFWSAFDIPNPNDVLKNKPWHDMTKAEKTAQNDLYTKHSLIKDGELDRADPLLIRVVEELGKDADGRCAELSIVEIPDGTDYEIQEYDGLEHIAETHQTWR